MPRSLVRAVIFAATVATATVAGASDWFTIVGDPSDADADTIQLDPVARKTAGAIRTMGIRVSRSTTRTSADGIAFRSFEGVVEFDCQRQAARFIRSQFYSGPLWRVPGPLVEYPPGEVRPMAFRLFEPNPRERVIRAACRPYTK